MIGECFSDGSDIDLDEDCCNCSQITLECGCTVFGHGKVTGYGKWQIPCTHGSYAPCKKHQKPLYEEAKA